MSLFQATATPREVIAIDTGVPDWQSLITHLDPSIAVILLPAGGNGLAALALALEDYGTLDALHIVSHGSSGQLDLGGLRLNTASLDGQGAALAAIASHLAPNSDVLLCGCSVAEGAAGQAFVGALSAALGGVDVAASVNVTGAAMLGGDWMLEYAHGHIETALPFAPQDVVLYNATLLADDGSAPTNPALSSGSDTGVSSSDRITKTTSLTFTGHGGTSEPITLYRDGAVSLGSTTTDPNGNWTITVTGAVGTHNYYAESINGDSGNTSVTIDTTAPAAPSAPLMSAASDAGFSTSDGVTKTTTPVFVGTAETGAAVTLYDTNGTTVLGTGTADGSGNWSITSTTLSQGVHTLSAKAADLAGNVSSASTATSATIDTTAPTVTITSSVAAVKIGETASITFTFSEDPGTTFTAGDISLLKGTLGALAGTGLVRTATFTPTANTNSAAAKVAVLVGSYTDAAGNSGGAGITPLLTVDTLKPSTPTAPALDSASDHGVSSSDRITNLATPLFTGLSDGGSTVTLFDTDGTTVLGTGTALGNATWSITSATLAPGAHTLTVKATDPAGNVSLASPTTQLTIDTTAPTVSMASSAAHLAAGGSATITFTFSEALGAAPSGFSVVGGGTLGTVSGSGGTYTASYTAPSTGVGAASINLPGTGYADVAGNSGATVTPAVLSFGTSAPAALTLAAASDSGVSATDHLTKIATPVITGTATAGSTVTLYDSDGSSALGTATADSGGAWSITSGALGEGLHTLTAKADEGGSTSVASAGLDLTIDLTAPMVAISSNVASLTIGETATITFTFSEDPGATFTWNGSSGDVVASGGTLGAISGAGLTRTATFTPTAAIDSGTASITVTAASYADTAGNGGAAGSTPSLGFDTLAPTNTVATAALGTDTGSSATDFITRTAAQTIAGTLAANLAAGQGVQVSIDNGATWHAASATPGSAAWSYATTLVASDTLKVRVIDTAGNAGTPYSHAYVLDQLAPAAPGAPALAPASDTGTVGDASTLATTPIINGTAEANAPVTLYDSNGTTVLATATADGAGAWSATSSALSPGVHQLSATQADTAGNVSPAGAPLALTIVAPAAPPPVPPPPMVDGVAVTSVPVALAGGGIGTRVNVPVVMPERVDTNGNDVADIPLVTASGTTTLLAQLAPGFGLSAQGGSSTPAGAALTPLLAAISAATPAGSGDQPHLHADSAAFIALLPSSVPLLIETVMPTSAATAPGGALTLTGTSNASQHTALVIDASGIAAGAQFTLKAVDFAAVVGAAAVTGTTAGQILSGDGASQQFSVAASLGSTVFAGGGNDSLIVTAAAASAPLGAAAAPLPAGATTLHGGTGFDTAVFSGARAGYTLDLHDGYLVVSPLAAPQQKTLVVNVESLKFADATVAVDNHAGLTTLAGLYQMVLGRQADVAGFDFWGGAGTRGASLGHIAVMMMSSSEALATHQSFNGDAVHDLTLLYQDVFGRAIDSEGLAFWGGAMAHGVTLEQVADGVVHSAEFATHALTVQGWNFTL